MIRPARERSAGLDNVTFVETDFLGTGRPLPEGRFGFVSAVAVIHHVAFGPALQAMDRLPPPGGRLVIIGLARNRTPLDWIVSAAGVPAARAAQRRRDRPRRHADQDAHDDLG
jgi:SAM-dependent methyltransferase